MHQQPRENADVILCRGCNRLTLVACSALLLAGAGESRLKTLEFPGDMKVEAELPEKVAAKRFKRSARLQVAVEPVVVNVLEQKLVLTAWLENPDQDLDLIVMPYGGDFPYGGNSPLLFRFAASAATTVVYSGELFPPGPPLPMAIRIPAASRVRFTAEIDLGSYTYTGAPEVELDWGFHYHHRSKSHPKGVVKVRLPEREALGP